MKKVPPLKNKKKILLTKYGYSTIFKTHISYIFLDYTVHNTYREFSNCTLKFEWLLFTVKFILNPGV